MTNKNSNEKPLIIKNKQSQSVVATIVEGGESIDLHVNKDEGFNRPPRQRAKLIKLKMAYTPPK